MVEERAKIFHDLGRQGSRSGDKQAHAAADIARGIGWSFEQANVHGWNAEKKRRAEFEKVIEDGLMIETFEQAHAAAGTQPTVETVAEGVDVKQGEGEQETVAIGDLPAGEKIYGVCQEIIVRENGALRRSGGPGGVDQGGGRVAVELGQVYGFLGFRDESGKLTLGHEKLGLGVAQDVRNLTFAVQNVYRDEDHAELHTGKEQIDHLDTIGKIHAQAVAEREAFSG